MELVYFYTHNIIYYKYAHTGMVLAYSRFDLQPPGVTTNAST